MRWPYSVLGIVNVNLLFFIIFFLNNNPSRESHSKRDHGEFSPWKFCLYCCCIAFAQFEVNSKMKPRISWTQWITVTLKPRPNDRNIVGGHSVMCCDMLGVAGSSLKMVVYEPTTTTTSVAACHNRTAKRAKRVAPNNWDMLRSFGRGLTDALFTSLILHHKLSFPLKGWLHVVSRLQDMDIIFRL